MSLLLLFPSLTFPPIIDTLAVSGLAYNNVTFNGVVYNTGPGTVTERGFQFGNTPYPDQSYTQTGSLGSGTFSASVSSLTLGKVYYVRSYAIVSGVTYYGPWISFTTSKAVYNITINGVDRTADVINASIVIEDAINDKQTNCNFQLYDRQSLGVPLTDQEITITLNSGAKIFGGKIIKVTTSEVRGTYKLITIACVDYTRLMDENLVNQTYIGQTDQAIIQNIVDNYCQGLGITYNNVQLGVTIDQIAFNYIQPSKAMRVISDLTGRNWYIDYNKDIHYFPLTQNAAPFNITDSQLFSAGQGYFDLAIVSDASQLKNRVYVRGGTKLSDPTSYLTKGDGTKRKFSLPDKPHSTTIKVNGVTKTMGIKNIDTAGFNFYLNFEEKYVEQDAGDTVLATTDTLELDYTYDIPILVAVENTASIAANGPHEFVIVDSSISTTQAARDRASAELTDYANNLVEGQFSTYADGFRSGQYVNINSTVLGITNTNYIVQKVQARSLGSGNYMYTVFLASAKTMGIIRFLLELLEANKNVVQVSTNEVLDNLLAMTDSLDPNSLTDSLTIDSAGPYRTWCKDSLESTNTRAVWGLFEWG